MPGLLSIAPVSDVMISRTGFTGDLGYELWIDPDHAPACQTFGRRQQTAGRVLKAR